MEARNAEPQANFVLAQGLKSLNPNWTDATVHAERTNVLQSGSTKKPDILIAQPRRQPVVVETEFFPALTVVQDSISRLGDRLRSNGAEIESVLSVVLPEKFRTGDLAEIKNAEFKYRTHYLNANGEKTQWPLDRTLSGGLHELADAIEHISLSERKLALGTSSLEDTVRNVAALISEHLGAEAMSRISECLHQEKGDQTNRMAAAICISSFVFHAAIEEHATIPAIPTRGKIGKTTLLDTWNEILKINYWPIFSIARELLIQMPTKAVPPIMNRIVEAVDGLAEMGATTYHDLAGRMFQTLIADRKFLATFYTLPESAYLLAELALNTMDTDWSDRHTLENLRIADFACGTGALLSAAQRSVYRRYRRTGGDDAELHQTFMEKVLLGLDIMPSATHLTCSMLASAYPSQSFGSTQIHTLPYGNKRGGTFIGSLNLLTSEYSQSLFPIGETITGTKVSNSHQVQAHHQSCDLVIMNPPFTRPTNHEGAHGEIPIPSFAGFSTDRDEQKAMSSVLKRTKGKFSHGNAGLASNFLDLAHRKLKRNGVLAAVLPFTFVRGKSWENARRELNAHYTDIQVHSIVATGPTARAFSADTGIAECLVVAKKTRGGRATFVNLNARPATHLEASIQATDLKEKSIKGNVLDGGAAGVNDPNLAKFMSLLLTGQFWNVRQNEHEQVPITTLAMLGKNGLLSRDLTGPSPRGAFERSPLKEGRVPIYPSIWAHNADLERSFFVDPDCELNPRAGFESRAADTWTDVASRLHLSIDFRLNSQSLAACLTRKRTLGGRAWPNFLLEDEDHEYWTVIWLNTTLGLMTYWWVGTRQNTGRTSVSFSRLPTLPILDFRQLSERQRLACHSIFERFCERKFQPANESFRDPVRNELDEAVVVEVLELSPDLLDEFALVRKQWCSEPSVYGTKPTGPNN